MIVMSHSNRIAGALQVGSLIFGTIGCVSGGISGFTNANSTYHTPEVVAMTIAGSAIGTCIGVLYPITAYWGIYLHTCSNSKTYTEIQLQ